MSAPTEMAPPVIPLAVLQRAAGMCDGEVAEGVSSALLATDTRDTNDVALALFLPAALAAHGAKLVREAHDLVDAPGGRPDPTWTTGVPSNCRVAADALRAAAEALEALAASIKATQAAGGAG